MPNITGRDAYIITHALAIAAAAIAYLPDLYRSESDRLDMLDLLRARTPNAQFYLDGAAEMMAHFGESKSF